MGGRRSGPIAAPRRWRGSGGVGDQQDNAAKRDKGGQCRCHAMPHEQGQARRLWILAYQDGLVAVRPLQSGPARTEARRRWVVLAVLEACGLERGLRGLRVVIPRVVVAGGGCGRRSTIAEEWRRRLARAMAVAAARVDGRLGRPMRRVVVVVEVVAHGQAGPPRGKRRGGSSPGRGGAVVPVVERDRGGHSRHFGLGATTCVR